ncbi:MAG: HipA N-terminal domain-containing protein [Deltaproteobacteria bacterium]|nr:HipA N-terminal domain-containing protein [Deltaproteobacteria bacterium]
MRKAEVFVNGVRAGVLEERKKGRSCLFVYDPGYSGMPVSLTIPVETGVYKFDGFPPFFDGLLPEGKQLEALLRLRKLDRDDLFGQLVAIGADMVGAVTVKEIE